MEKKPEVKRVTLLFPVELWEALRTLAQAHRRPHVGEIIWIVREHLKQQDKT